MDIIVDHRRKTHRSSSSNCRSKESAFLSTVLDPACSGPGRVAGIDVEGFLTRGTTFKGDLFSFARILCLVKIWMPHLQFIKPVEKYYIPLGLKLLRQFFRGRWVKVRATSRELAGLLSKSECEWGCSSTTERSNKKLGVRERTHNNMVLSVVRWQSIESHLFADVYFAIIKEFFLNLNVGTGAGGDIGFYLTVTCSVIFLALFRGDSY